MVLASWHRRKCNQKTNRLLFQSWRKFYPKMVWMLFSVTASLTTHTLITRIVGVLPVTDCGRVEDPKKSEAYYASKVSGLLQVSRGYQHEELVYIWLHLLHCRWSLRPGLLIEEEFVQKLGSWQLYFIRCSVLCSKHPTKYKAQSQPLSAKKECRHWSGVKRTWRLICPTYHSL